MRSVIRVYPQTGDLNKHTRKNPSAQDEQYCKNASRMKMNTETATYDGLRIFIRLI
jgi:hypothetical protein